MITLTVVEGEGEGGRGRDVVVEGTGTVTVVVGTVRRNMCELKTRVFWKKTLSVKKIYFFYRSISIEVFILGEMKRLILHPHIPTKDSSMLNND